MGAREVTALVAYGVGEEPLVQTITLPEPGPDDVRVRIHAAGVCHSDLGFIEGKVVGKFPMVLGHESAGVVAEVGADVDRVAVGDHVVLNWVPPCRKCWHCLHGEPWLCSGASTLAVTPRVGLPDGTQATTALGVGGFAEEVVVPQSAVVPVPRELPFEVAAILGCAVLTGFGAVRNTARVQPGESVAVWGLGGVGLSVVAAAKLAGAEPIVAIDVNPDKEELAKHLGATHFEISDDQLVRRLRKLTEGRGVDHAVECVGKPVTIQSAWGAARRGGCVVVIGAGGKQDMVQLSALELFWMSRRLHGSVYGESDVDRDLPVLVDTVLSGDLDAAALVTGRISLAEIPAAFDRMRRGEGVRSLVLFD